MVLFSAAASIPIMASSSKPASAEGNQNNAPGSGESGQGAEDSPEPGAVEQLQTQAELGMQEQDREERQPSGPPVRRQYLVVMRHGERIDEVDKAWGASSDRPFDPWLSPKGEEQAKDVAARLKKFNFQHVYISPFYRTIQTARFAAEGLGIDPSRWTISCLVAEFLSPRILVRKGGVLPEGHINDWFWENQDPISHLKQRLPGIADKVKFGELKFKRYPENLLNSRARYGRAFQELAEEAGGENLLVVTHWDGISASVTRLLPWALVYPVLHTGWTAAYREQFEDGSWSRWELESKSGENGVTWTDKLKPAYKVLNFVVGTAQAVGNTYHHYAPGWAPFQFPDSPPTADQTKG